MDVEPAIVVNEAQFLEFVHEHINPGARGANHFRQRFLRYFGENSLRLAFLAVASKQQKSAGQPLFAGIKELIDQILLESDVP